MKILLIANKGKLQRTVEKKIEKNNKIFLYLINKNLDLFDLLKGFRKIFLKNKFDLIIFLSGETRDENKMMLLNYLLPKEILLIIQSKFIPLIYLSSLSVFGIPRSNKIEEFSVRQSIDLYSTTKNLFDNFAKKNCVNASIVSILPGSIINFKSKNDITNKLIKFSKSFPQHLIFSRFHPQGNIACIGVQDLANSILFEVNKLAKRDQEIIFKSKICTINLSISKILRNNFINKRIFLISNLTFLNSRILLFVFEKTFLKKLVLLFNNVEYESSYLFCEKSYWDNLYF